MGGGFLAPTGSPPAPRSSVTGTKNHAVILLVWTKCICGPATAHKAGWKGQLECGLHPERFGLGDQEGGAPGADRWSCLPLGLSSTPHHKHHDNSQRLASVLVTSGVGIKLSLRGGDEPATRGPSEQSDVHTWLGLPCSSIRSKVPPIKKGSLLSAPCHSPPPNRERGRPARARPQPLGWWRWVAKEEC